MNIRRGVQGQRRTGLLFLVEAVVDCVEWGVYRDR
jgi:hypothetical protein